MPKKEKEIQENNFEECYCTSDYKKYSILMLAFGVLFIMVGTEIVRFPPTVNGWSVLGLMLILIGILRLVKP
ncbi:MAG: hypothetical protein QXU92_02405 [Candidatus Diapherotrites archaeon]